ncbi:hypothetical protein L2E82_51574 [Cichorium intybus]|nr:hypothetical protein L2E82_51574 [Cichorium intybus]
MVPNYILETCNILNLFVRVLEISRFGIISCTQRERGCISLCLKTLSNAWHYQMPREEKLEFSYPLKRWGVVDQGGVNIRSRIKSFESEKSLFS